jgi:predicted TIM-barrel fold metal-dependent hydrolase
MLQSYRIYDADAHVKFSPRMWETLPPEYASRRPRPLRAADESGMGAWNNGWLIDGKMEPHPFGPGTQGADKPRDVLVEFGASAEKATSYDLSSPKARLDHMDQLGIDCQMLFPTTLYAKMNSDPGFEAAMYRAYNRYIGEQCKCSPRRLKWSGLLPLRDKDRSLDALDEMQNLGATAAVVYGTVEDKLLSDPSFKFIWAELARRRLPLCVHMGMSYPPFEKLSESRLEAHAIGMSLPGLLAFVAIVGHGIVDRYPDLKVAFLEFGAEWLFYMVGRIGHYLPTYRQEPAIRDLPQNTIEDSLKSGRIFIAPEAEDRWLLQEMELIGEDQIVYSSDFPHGEAREEAAAYLLDRKDLSANQKRKIFYDNAARLFGEP